MIAVRDRPEFAGSFNDDPVRAHQSPDPAMASIDADFLQFPSHPWAAIAAQAQTRLFLDMGRNNHVHVLPATGRAAAKGSQPLHVRSSRGAELQPHMEELSEVIAPCPPPAAGPDPGPRFDLLPCLGALPGHAHAPEGQWTPRKPRNRAGSLGAHPETRNPHRTTDLYRNLEIPARTSGTLRHTRHQKACLNLRVVVDPKIQSKNINNLSFQVGKSG